MGKTSGFRGCRVLRILATSALAASCARAPIDQYSIVAGSATPIATSRAEAIRLAEPRRLVLDEPLEAEIDVDDPRIQIGDTLANYELFIFELGEDLSFVLDLTSFQTSAWGARVLLIHPWAYVMDNAGAVIETNVRLPINVGYTSWRGACSRWQWAGRAPKPGSYYFLVRAYNEKVGALSRLSVPETHLIDPTSLGLQPTFDDTPVVNYPTGAIVVRLTHVID